MKKIILFFILCSGFKVGHATCTLVATPSSTCVSSTVALELNSNPGGGPTFAWAGQDVVNATGSFSTTATPSIAGTFIYTVVVSSGTGPCGSGTFTVSVTADPPPTAISGTLSVCAGSTTALNSTPASGTWSSSAPGVATVGTSGIVTGVASVTVTSTAIISYVTTCGTVTATVTVNPLPTVITGSLGVCAGSTTTLNSTPAGGAWTSNNGNATIDGTSGVVSGVTAGTSTISYTLGTTCAVGAVVTVNSVPTAITGTLSFCAGQSTTLNSTPAGGTWSSSSGVAVIGSISGIITSSAASSGTSTISYVRNGCASSTIVTVNELPTTITGTKTVCAGATTTLNSTPATGTWSSSNGNSLIADGTIGIVTGVTAGTSTISYILSTGCAVSTVVTVIPLPGTITTSGSLVICKGLTTTLSNTPAGGAWASSNTAAGTVNSASGVVTGINAGTTLISYTTGCGSSAPVTITVNALPPAISGASSVCVGSTITLSDADVNPGTWSSSSPGNASIDVNTGVVTGVLAGATIITFEDNVTGCKITTNITANALPNITLITNNSPVCVGSTLTFNSTATGQATLLFAWNGPSFSSGSQNPTIPSATLGAGGVYSLIVTDGNGCKKSSTTTATVNSLPSIVSVSPDLTSYCSGNSIVLTANGTSGTGSILSYSWSGPAAFSSTSAGNSKTVPSVSTAAAGVYSVRVTFTGVGCISAVSTTSSIAVNPTPTVTVTGKSICSGAQVNLFLNVTTPSNISWTIGTNTGGITGANPGSGGELTDALTNPSTTTANTLQYLVTPTAAIGSCPGATASVVITVNPTPVMTSTTSATTCGALSLPLTASTASNFAWTIGTILPLPNSITGAFNSNGSTITQTLTNGSNTNPGSVEYIVTPTSTTGSCAGSPVTITVTVNPGPSLTSPTTKVVCSDEIFSIPLTSTTSGSFNWTVGTISGGITGASGGSGTSIPDQLHNPSSTSIGTVVYNVTPVSGSSCPGGSTAVTVTVNPLPSVTTSGTASTCSGVGLNIGLTTSISSTFQWGVNSTTGSVSGGSSTNGATSITDNLINPSNSTLGTVVYSVMPTSTGGTCSPASPSLITVTVNPKPALNPTAGIATCGAFTVALTATATSSFAWTIGTITGGILGSSPAGGNSIIQTLSNPSNSTVGTVDYSIVPTSSFGCVGNPTTVTVSVNPAPSLTSGTSNSTCSGVPLSITLTSSTSSNFNWTIANAGTVSGGLPGSGSTITDNLTNPSNSSIGVIVYSVTPTSSGGGCSGSATLVSVTVNPSPSVSTSSTASTCSNVGLNIALTATTGSSFSWGVNSTTGGITGASSTNGATSIVDNLTNPSNSALGTVVYSVMPTSTIGSCSPTSPALITVTVFPTPALTSTTSATTCGVFTVPLTGSVASSFSWTIGTITGGILGAFASSGSSISQSLSNPSNSTVGSVQYQVTPTSNIGSCAGNPTVVSVSVNPAPALTSGTGFSVCSNASLNIPLGSSTSSNFNWSVSNAGTVTGGHGGSGTTITDILVNPSNSSIGLLVYSVVPTSSDGGCTGSASLVTVTVNPLPILTSAITAVICSGSGLHINLAASVASSFVWGENSQSGGITGSSTSTTALINDVLTNPDHSAIGSLVYTVIPTSTAGACPAASSAQITVTINPTPVLTSPLSVTICSNGSPTYSLTATTGSDFSWTIGAISGGIAGAFGSSATIINQTLFNPSNSTAGSVDYIVTPVSKIGNCSGSVAVITVGVNPAPDVTTSTSASVCSSAPLSVPLSSSAPSTFNWGIGTVTGSIAGANPGSGTTITDNLTNPSTSVPGTVVYNVTAISSVGTCTSTPTAITVVVNPSPVVTTSSSASTCSDVNPNIALTASTPSSFAWSFTSVTGGITNASSGFTSVIDDVLSNPSNSSSGSVTYTVSATSITGSCVSLTQTTINVVVNPTPSITNSSTDTTCSGADHAITLLPTTPSNFTWSLGTPIGGITGGATGSGGTINLNLTNPSNSAAGTQVYLITPIAIIGSCQPTSPIPITVVVNPAPGVQGLTTAQRTTCSNNPSMKVPLSATTGTGATFTWAGAAETGLVTGATNNVTDTITDVLHNPSDSTFGTVAYTITPTSLLGCLGANALVVVTVNPLPVVNGTLSAICSQTSPNIPLVPVTTAPSSYTWAVANNSTATSNVTSGSTPIINATLTNSGHESVGTVIFTVTPTSNLGCLGSVGLFTVNVNPIPKLRSTADTFVCSEHTLLYQALPSTDVSNTRYSWTLLPHGLNITGLQNSVSTDSTGQINDFISSSQSLFIDSVSYRFSIVSLGCSSDTNVVFIVNPRPQKPNITTFTPDSLCANTFFQNFGANIPADTLLVLYKWTATNAVIFDTSTTNINRNILVNFTTSGVPSTITVTAHVSGFGCFSDSSRTVIVGSTKSDDPAVVLYRNGMFICEKNDVDRLGYQWGYDEAGTLFPHDLVNEINQNYFNPNPDTLHQFFWVKTTHGDCPQKSYYNRPDGNFRSTPVSPETVSMSAYPNPAKSSINIEMGDVSDGDFTAEIYDLTGRKLLAAPLKERITEISVENLSPGYYVIECRKNGRKLAVAKFIKN